MTIRPPRDGILAAGMHGVQPLPSKIRPYRYDGESRIVEEGPVIYLFVQVGLRFDLSKPDIGHLNNSARNV